MRARGIGIVVTAIFFIHAGCTNSGRYSQESRKLDPQTQASIEEIKDIRVFFGHQSVGGNILDGLAGLEAFEIPIVDIREDVEFPEGPVVLHATIGQNAHPDEKISDFALIMRSGVAEQTDVSFMKFCYVDANQGMSAEEIFCQYIDEMEALEKEFLNTKFVYVTMPLTSPQSNPKNLFKRVLGMPLYGHEENLERQRFNDMLREAKGDTGRLFDIARFESTRPNGSIFMYKTKDTAYEALVPGYTSDGGHLNELGCRLVAEALVQFLALLNEDKS